MDKYHNDAGEPLITSADAHAAAAADDQSRYEARYDALEGPDEEPPPDEEDPNYCSTCQTDDGPADGANLCLDCQALICKECCTDAHWCKYCGGYVCDVCDNDSAHRHLPTTESAPPPPDCPTWRSNWDFPITEETLEPDWPSMFNMAQRLVVKQFANRDGRDFVLEMLAFGRRLYENQNVTKATQSPSNGSK